MHKVVFRAVALMADTSPFRKLIRKSPLLSVPEKNAVWQP